MDLAGITQIPKPGERLEFQIERDPSGKPWAGGWFTDFGSASSIDNKVTSEDSAGQSDGVKGSVSHLTTPAPGEIINNYLQPK